LSDEARQFKNWKFLLLAFSDRRDFSIFENARTYYLPDSSIGNLASSQINPSSLSMIAAVYSDGNETEIGLQIKSSKIKFAGERAFCLGVGDDRRCRI
jgi:hypothetical protein